ncbi:MAG: hypothetical protein APF77_06775 [Clostridia bacterium BRH_c25]|nr:MAG: hypothetical protein APF77_06775 [Clostridia bacterium BRH_c25]
MIRKIAAVYSILIGISVLCMWGMIILTGGIIEGPIQISFHLVSEFLMAILLIISGIGLLKSKKYGNKVFFISNGMLIYSVLNAAGYYGQQSNFAMLFMFIVIFIISLGFIIQGLLSKENLFISM